MLGRSCRLLTLGLGLALALAWDGRLFLVGYSEGAYAALAAVKEFETHGETYAAAGLRLTGSACMAGPFDLSGTMRAAFIEKVRLYSRAYYLPYFVLGYHAVYGPRLDPRRVLAPALLAEGGDGDVLAWADGRRGGEAVDAALGARLDADPEAISLRALFDPAWLARELDDPAYGSSATHALPSAFGWFRDGLPAPGFAMTVDAWGF